MVPLGVNAGVLDKAAQVDTNSILREYFPRLADIAEDLALVFCPRDEWETRPRRAFSCLDHSYREPGSGRYLLLNDR